MYWNASALNGYSIEATDGRLGTVSDLLFEDTSWAIRWMVVDTGHWLSGRKVLVPFTALWTPDPVKRELPVTLTMAQVRNSPDIGADQPVSRQMEASVFGHYNLEPYWVSNAIATPFVAPLFGSDLIARSRPVADIDGADRHLRSVAAVIGYHIDATDGEIGHVEDFLVDDGDWRIRYIKVDTRNWWPGERVLISPSLVREVDWTLELVHLFVNRQKVEHSPAYDPLRTVDKAYEERYRGYYGVGWSGMPP
jgi:hypothetical protein